MDSKLLRNLALLEVKKKNLEKELEVVKSMISRVGQKLHYQFVDEGIESQILQPTIQQNGQTITIFQDGRSRTIKPISKPKVALPEKNKATFYAWLKENNLGEMVKEYVFPKTLESWVVSQRTKNLPLPDLISVHDVESVKVTLSRTKSPKKGAANVNSTG